MAAATTLERLPAPRYWALLAAGLAVLAAGLGAFFYMEHHGHVVTGMNNHIVWGMPHVFAIFMIVAASGVLNVASIGSVFGQAVYKVRAPLSALLCLALLGGGLMVLMLDLGRPDRIIVAATYYNFTSVFAWNVFLYSGMFAIVAVYLWTLTERRMNRWSKHAGLAAFVWRLVLTTGTGSIFAFIVARPGYGSAMLAPMFIVMSFAWGLALFLLVQAVLFRVLGAELDPAIQRRMKNLLGVFVAATLYFVVMYHVTNLYFARQTGFERFILVEGGIHSVMLWVGYGLVGTVLPLVLLYHPTLGMSQRANVFAAVAVIAGAFALLYAFIIGGQAYPMELFPGYEVASGFGDGEVADYSPSLPEVLLGLGGVAAAFLITLVGVRLLPFVPVDAPAK